MSAKRVKYRTLDWRRGEGAGMRRDEKRKERLGHGAPFDE